MGEEFQFYYKNESYWISHNMDGFYLTREADSYTQAYTSAEGLFKNGQIDGKTIFELWDIIEM